MNASSVGAGSGEFGAEPPVGIRSPRRLAAVERSRLLDSPPDEAFDRATRIATLHLGVPVALVSIVDDHRQFFKSAIGLSEPWASRRETPLSHSFCQYVVSREVPLVVDDARLNPVLRGNRAIEDLGVVAYCGVPLYDGDGEVLGALCAIEGEPRAWLAEDIAVLIDLAEGLRSELRLRRALVEADHLERNRSEMLAVLGHDLRSPLAVVCGAVALLADGWQDFEPQDIAHMLGSIDRQARQATELLDRLLNLEGRLPDPHVDAIDVRGELKAIARVSQESHGDRVVAVEVDGLGCELRSDVQMLRQILGNLVDNAFKHGGADVNVTISAHRLEDFCILVVSDDGIGIAPDRLGEIFDRFVGRSAGGGHGLGLHIVQRLVDALGGVVAVDSELGKGTMFTVSLPGVAPAGSLP